MTAPERTERKPPRPTVRLSVTGDLATVDPADRERLIQRDASAEPAVGTVVASIVERVKRDGDAALIEFAARFDGATLDDVEVAPAECAAALVSIEPALRAALRRAATAIAAFHRAQLPGPIVFEPAPGVRLTRGAQPLDRVGVYAPGGRASYPSSVLMGAIPARVAGVGEVVVCSPPDETGLPPTAVLAACAIAGVNRVFAVGGAGAVAAMAFGTQSVPAVRRIVGPGNVWVNEAKRQVQGVTGIDCPAGPSEILVIADDTADPVLVAAELIAQAEHDPDAAAVLISTDRALLESVEMHLASLVAGHERENVIRSALSSRGALLYADLDSAVRFASDYAPEHLLLAVAEPRALSSVIRNAGTIFIGQTSSVVFGDYITGANHVLPTGGLARSFSGLNVLDFMRWTTTQEITAQAAAGLAEDTALLADAERLPGHAFAARLRARPANADTPPADGPVVERNTVRHGRVAYRDIRTYDPGRMPVAIDLSDNTNLFGVCPAVRSALADAPDATTTRYPTVYADVLRAAAAATFGVPGNTIVSGCGSDDVIDSALRAFCEPGDVVAFPWPTFGIVPTFARMNSARPVSVEQSASNALDVDALLRTGARVIYLCNPNNPTGQALATTDIVELATAFDGVVLLDEAYADFADDDFIQNAVHSPNVIVLRTMSKAWGMAGLRVGFAIGAPALIAEVEKSRGPYKVSGPAERAAVAALRDGRAWVDDCVAQVRENRQRLSSSLRDQGHTVLPSRANFVLVPLPSQASAAAVYAELRERGVGVRPFEALPTLGDCIRVTVGPWDMMQAFLDAFREVCPAVSEVR